MTKTKPTRNPSHLDRANVLLHRIAKRSGTAYALRLVRAMDAVYASVDDDLDVQTSAVYSEMERAS